MEEAKLIQFKTETDSKRESSGFHAAEDPHLEHWNRVARLRGDIGAIALNNYHRVHELREGLYAHRLSDEEMIELGLSFGADNDMEGGQDDLVQIFARLYQNNINALDTEFYHHFREEGPSSLYGLMMRIDVGRQEPSMKLFHAAQFLHESAELETDPLLRETLLYGAVDIYERIWRDEPLEWSEAYKRQALLHWHGSLSSLIAEDMGNPGLSPGERERADEYFREVQTETIEQARDFAKLRGVSRDNPENEYYVVRNGELFEVFAQVGGWYLIREEELFGDFEIRPAKERANRPQDHITGTKLRKYAHDAVVVHGDEKTRIQLKACPQEQDWESKYVRDIPVVRIKHISEDRLRKKLLKSMRQINGHYRSPKKRAQNQLKSHVREFFSEDIFGKAA